jgi:hypothetical protein
MTAYVDDINAHLTHPNEQSRDQTTEIITNNTKIWEKLLYVSGGKLSRTKRTYYSNKWNFTTMTRPTSDPTEPKNITIQTKEGTIKIQGISSKTYHKTLGYLHSIGRPKQTHYEALQNKTMETLTKVKEAHLDYKDFSRYYKTVMSPKITYILGLTFLSKTKSDNLTKKMLQPTLRKRNFNGTTPRGKSLGSKKRGGLQSIDVYIYQG